MRWLVTFVAVSVYCSCEADPDPPAAASGGYPDHGLSGGATQLGGRSTAGGVSAAGNARAVSGGAPHAAGGYMGAGAPAAGTNSGGTTSAETGGWAVDGGARDGNTGDRNAMTGGRGSSPGEAGSAGSARETSAGAGGARELAGAGGGSEAAAPCDVTPFGTAPSIAALHFGSHNHAFTGPFLQTDPVTNYVNQVVFDHETIRILANYSVAPASELTPANGTALDPWLGELVLVPAGCDASTLLGKTLHLTLLWRLNGAITQDPWSFPEFPDRLLV